jgi:hypothetical protein
MTLAGPSERALRLVEAMAKRRDRRAEQTHPCDIVLSSSLMPDRCSEVATRCCGRSANASVRYAAEVGTETLALGSGILLAGFLVGVIALVVYAVYFLFFRYGK